MELNFTTLLASLKHNQVMECYTLDVHNYSVIFMNTQSPRTLPQQ